MGYIKIRLTKVFAVGAVLTLCLTGCGVRNGSDNSGLKSSAEENISKESQKKQREKGEGSERGEGEGVDVTKVPENTVSTKTGNMVEAAAYTENGIPIYEAGNKNAIKAYLAKLPDKYLSYQKAKELGIIRGIRRANDLTKKQKSYFEKQWMSFYSRTKESNDIVEGKYDKDKGTVYKDAVVIVDYTIEGAPIYCYVSYDNGKYYLYSDSSRDKYGCRSSEDGFYVGPVYDEIRWYLVDGEEEATEFYLVENSKMSLKRMDKMLNSGEGSKELYLVYGFDYIVDTIDGAVICR